ncbi:hypothetical protein MMC27_007924 [Xylographa pallens]|nr:hypothetical protein [Xylographa pallens]
MDASTNITVSAGDTTTAAAVAANEVDQVKNDALTDSSSDSDSIDLEALYEASRGAPELPGLRGLSIVGSSAVIDPNTPSNTGFEPESTTELPFRDNNPLIIPTRVWNRPALVPTVPIDFPGRSNSRTSRNTPSILRQSPGPPPTIPLPPTPVVSRIRVTYSPEIKFFREPKKHELDPGVLERDHAIAEIQNQAEREGLEAEHQRRLTEPDQNLSDKESSFWFRVQPSTPESTNSSMTTGNTSQLERDLLFVKPLPRHRARSATYQNMEATEILGNNNDTTLGNRAQPEIVPEMPEARRNRPCRYTIHELMQLRYVANISFDQLHLSEEAPIDLVVRATSLPNSRAVDMPSQSSFMGARARDPWMSDDDEMVLQGGAPVSNPRRTAILPESQESFGVLRQPFNPPEGEAAQALEGFARFLKEHASPSHKRVTAGGRIVSAGPNSPPPTFHIGFIDGVLQQFNQSQFVREAFEKQARDAEEEERQKAMEEAGVSGNNPGLLPSSSNGLTAGTAGDAGSTSNHAVNVLAVNNQSQQQQAAASGMLTLPPGSQPMLMAGDGTTIFHMGGSMFRAVLRGSETLYELLTPVQPVGHVPVSDNISQAMSEQTIMAVPQVAPFAVVQPLTSATLQTMFPTQMANPVPEMNSVQSMPQMTAMQQFQHVPTLPAMRPILAPSVLGMTQSALPIVPGHGYGQDLHHSFHVPSGNALLQDSGRREGHETATMAVQLYNPQVVNYPSRQPSLHVQLQNVENRMRSLMNHKSELEQQWALEEWQMTPIEKTWNRDQLRQCTLQYDDVRKMKKTLECSISFNSDGRTGLASSGNILPAITRPAPRGYAYNGRDSMRTSFASTISNDTYNGEFCDKYQGAADGGHLQNPFSHSFPGNPRYKMAQLSKERNNSKPLSPSAPAFVPGGLAFSSPQKPKPRHQASTAREGKSSEPPVFDPYGTTKAAMSGADWPTVINLNYPAVEIDEADIKYCEEAGFNDPRKPKQYCTTALEVAWVLKNVRQQAKLFGCKNGSSKDPEWDAEQDIRHAILVLRRPIPLAPMLPDFVRRMCPWSWEDSIFNIGQGMGPFWVAEQHHHTKGEIQVEAQIDLWSHERLLALEAKIARSREVGHTNMLALGGISRRELSYTASSRKRSDSVVSWDSDMARAADKALASAKKSKKQSLKPFSQMKAAPHQDLDDSVFDIQSYRRRGQSDIAHLTSDHSVDNQFRDPAPGKSHERRQAKYSYEQSNVNDSVWNTQVKTVPVESPTSNKQSKTLLRNMLDLKIKDWEPLPGETQEEFEKAYFAGKHIFEVAKAGSNQKSDLEFPPMKQMTTKENRPFQNQQLPGKANENVPRLRHKARFSMASPVFNAQGIVPPVTSASSVSTYLSTSTPGVQRHQEQVTGSPNNGHRGFGESSNSRQTAFTESSGPRNWQAPPLTGRYTRTRPGDYSSQHRSTEDTSRNQNLFGYGPSHYYQPPQSRRG